MGGAGECVSFNSNLSTLLLKAPDVAESAFGHACKSPAPGQVSMGLQHLQCSIYKRVRVCGVLPGTGASYACAILSIDGRRRSYSPHGGMELLRQQKAYGRRSSTTCLLKSNIGEVLSTLPPPGWLDTMLPSTS
jgi:hypothetical protein